MSSIDDFVNSQQEYLTNGMQNLSIDSNSQLQAPHPPTAATTSNSKKKRTHHAFHNLTPSYVNHVDDPYLDPNAASSTAGLVPPQFINSGSSVPNSNFGSYPQSPSMISQQFSQSRVSSQLSNTPIETHKDQQFYSQQQSQQSQQPQQPQQPSYPNDTYNINQISSSQDLSVPDIRYQMDENFKNKVFLTFEHVAPPLSGTQYRVVDQANASPKFARSTMYSIPFSDELKQKSKIPLGILLRPFADFAQETTGDSAVPQVDVRQLDFVPRCRRCRTYLNPAMQHTGQSMICNICGFTSPLPSEYYTSMNSNGIRDDYYSRPELHTGVVDYIVPKDYNLNEEECNPLHQVFLIDLTHSAYKSKLIEAVCTAIRTSIYDNNGGSSLPKGSKISILGFDNNLHFFNLSSNLDQTFASVVTDLEEPFLPFYEGLFADPIESYNIIESVLNTIEQSQHHLSPEPALSAALKAAGLMLEEVGGGQIIAILSCLPSWGPGALRPKMPNNKTNDEHIKDILTADNKYYQDIIKKFVKNNIGLNLFVASNGSIDLINPGMVAIKTGGAIKQWLGFNIDRDEVGFIYSIKQVVNGTSGYQGQLKIRCSHGLQVSNYYGGFETIDGSGAPNISILSNETSIGCDFIYDSKLDTKKDAHFQAALLYTSSDGIRKVRIINLILSVTQRIADVFNFADQDAILNLILKQNIDKVCTTNIVTMRSSLIIKIAEINAMYKKLVAKQNTMPGQLIFPQSLRTLSMMILSVIKTKALKEKVLNPDLRVDSYFKLRNYHSTKLSAYLYPTLFCLHNLEDSDCMVNEETGLLNVPKSLSLTVSNLEIGGAYLIFSCDKLIIWLHSDINPLLLQDLFGEKIDSLDKLNPFSITALPKLDTHISEQVRNLCSYLSKHYLDQDAMSLEICRFHIDPNERDFQELFYEDKSSDLIWSYQDFLKHMHKQIETKSENLNNLADDNNDSVNVSRRFGIF